MRRTSLACRQSGHDEKEPTAKWQTGADFRIVSIGPPKQRRDDGGCKEKTCPHLAHTKSEVVVGYLHYCKEMNSIYPVGEREEQEKRL